MAMIKCPECNNGPMLNI